MLWLSAELPPDVPPACVVKAAQHYAIPTAALVSVLKQERGQMGRVYDRQTGRYFGSFQLSEKWLPKLSQWGFTPDSLQYNACANTVAGAYVLAYYKAREATWFNTFARFNVGSLKTPAQREAGYRYANLVMHHWRDLYQKWGQPS